jgi:hypothetical protein
MNIQTKESTARLKIAPNKRINLKLISGDIILHLEKTDGIEMTYPLTNPGAFFNEEVSDYYNYQIIVNHESVYNLELS